jgi:hypothetical protein
METPAQPQTQPATKPQEPSIFQTIVGYGKMAIHTLKDEYVITVSKIKDLPAISIAPPVVPIKEITAKQFLVLGKDDSIDFTEDYKKASVFKFVFGRMIIENFGKIMKKFPDLEVCMVPYSSIAFVEQVTKGE